MAIMPKDRKESLMTAAERAIPLLAAMGHGLLCVCCYSGGVRVLWARLRGGLVRVRQRDRIGRK